MSKRLRARPNKSRTLRPRSQKTRELEVPGQEPVELEEQQAAAVEEAQAPTSALVEERQTFPEPAVTGVSDHPPAKPAELEVVAPVAAAPLETAEDAAPVVVVVREQAPVETKPAPVVEAKKAEPAPVSKKEGRAKKSKSTSEPPPSRGEDQMASSELLESGVSAEFFRNEEDSVPPFVDSAEEMDEMTRTRTLTPAAIARRARLRRVVAGVVTFAAVLSLGVLGKVLVGSKTSSAAVPPAKQEMVAAAPVEAAKPVEAPSATPAPKPEAAKVDEPKKDDKAEADKPSDAKTGDTKTADAKAESDKPADAEKPAEAKAPDAATAAELKKKAESLLNRGDRKGAIPVAQAAIEADPSDAYPYLLLGSALQDSGKWKDGVEQYCECVRHATRGPINECRAMGGHK